jgi:predicted flap endonuclease-1-like 5' DNA nuclease
MIRQGKNVMAEFSDLPASPSVSDIAPIAKLCMDEFLSGNVDEVLIAYTDFINMLAQSPVVLSWLPLTPNSVADQVASEYIKEVPAVSENATDYEYEPSPAAVIDEIVPRFTELQLYQALLEAIASEHAARMTAMHSATDNASGLVEDLTLEYNKARQSAITSEILDIVGGSSALEATLKAKAKSKSAAQAQAVIDSMVSSVGESSKPSTNGSAKKSEAKKAEASKPETDDLTKIEGIGPKMSKALIAVGISTFAELAEASEEELTQAVNDAGMRLAPSIPTWAEQAGYAANGDWDGLQKLQDSLQGGRRVD